MPNYNIAMGARGTNVRPARNRAAAQQSQNALMQSRMQGLQFQQAQQKADSNRALQQAYQKNPALTPGAASLIMKQGGDYKGGFALEGQEQQRQLGEKQLKAADLSLMKEEGAVIGTLLGRSTDDLSKNEAVRRLAEQGILKPEEAEKLYQTPWSKELANNAIRASFTAQEQYANRIDTEKRIYDRERNARRDASQDAYRTGMVNKPAITLSNEYEKQSEKNLANSYTAQYDEMYADARNAGNENNTLYTLKAIGADTGALEPAKAWAGKFINAIGGDPEDFGLNNVDKAEAFIGIAGGAVLGKMQAQKGPQTAEDQKLIATTVATLGNTPAAAAFLIDVGIALNERKQEQFRFYDSWRVKNGSFKGANLAWDKHKKMTPMVGKHPDVGLPVFYNTFLQTMQADNPNMSDADIQKYWRQKYEH